jgi:hypothetical protein
MLLFNVGLLVESLAPLGGRREWDGSQASGGGRIDAEEGFDAF